MLSTTLVMAERQLGWYDIMAVELVASACPLCRQNDGIFTLLLWK